MNAPGSLSFNRLMAARRRKESEQWGEKEGGGGGDRKGTDEEREGRLSNKNGREDKQKGEDEEKEEEERRIHNQAEDNCYSHFTLFYFEPIKFSAAGWFHTSEPHLVLWRCLACTSTWRCPGRT